MILVRTAYFKSGVWGCIYRDNVPVCATLERPFLLGDNGLTKVNESCVPTGTYKFDIVMRHKGQSNAYLVPELQAVPGRSRIQIHFGNYIRDSLGCILVGTEMSSSGGDRAMILSSGRAFRRLMDSDRDSSSGDSITIQDIAMAYPHSSNECDLTPMAP